MDAQRITFVLTIAALFAGTAFAEPPSQGAPVRYTGNNGQSSWSNTAPTTAPTITSSPNSRYPYPQSTYPQNTAPTAAQPQSISGRAQSAFNETATSIKDGFNTGVQSASKSISNTAQQTFGTSGYPSQPTNPFATQSAAPAASSSASGNLAPPPWPTNTGTPAAAPKSSWDSAAPITPVDRSLLTNPTTSQSSSGWSSIGSSIAAPPMLTPQMPAPVNTTSFDNGPSFTTDSYRGTQPSFGSSANTAPQLQSPSTTTSTAGTDNWASPWGTSSDNNSAPISRTDNNQSRPVANRDSAFPTFPRVETSSQDTRSTVAKPADTWNDDSWSRNSQSPQNGAGPSIGAAKTAGIGSAGNNAPQLSPPAIGSAGNNMSFNGTNPNASQSPTLVNAAKPTQPATANGEPQPWVTLLVAILGLAGSLAGNVYLGWSYLDARQKYQALVRRTADTFRRTKSVAA